MAGSRSVAQDDALGEGVGVGVGGGGSRWTTGFTVHRQACDHRWDLSVSLIRDAGTEHMLSVQEEETQRHHYHHHHRCHRHRQQWEPGEREREKERERERGRAEARKGAEKKRPPPLSPPSLPTTKEPGEMDGT